MNNLKDNDNVVLLEDDEMSNVNGGINNFDFGLLDNIENVTNIHNKNKGGSIGIGAKSSTTFDLF